MESKATRYREPNHRFPCNAVEQEKGESTKRNNVTTEGNARKYFLLFRTRKINRMRTELVLSQQMVAERDNHISDSATRVHTT